MSKIKSLILSCLCACMCIMAGLIFVACSASEEKYNPYIKVSGLSTECEVGDELDYSNAKILYYENLEDEIPDEIELTRDMVLGFTSDTAGTRTLTVVYKTYETKMDYKIVSTEEIFNKYISADRFYYNTSNIKVQITDGQNNGNYLIKNGELYCSLGDYFTYVIKEGENFYEYSYSGNLGTKRKLKEDEIVTNYLQMSNAALPSSMFESIEEFKNNILEYSYSKSQNGESLELLISTEIGYVTFSAELIDGKFVSTKYDFMSDNSIFKSTISYDVENDEIPALPENVEFEVKKEEVLSAYNSAKQNLAEQTEVSCVVNGFDDGEEISGFGLYNGQIFYQELLQGNYTQNMWIIPENEKIYNYSIDTDGNYKYESSTTSLDYVTLMIMGFIEVEDNERLANAELSLKFVDGNSVYTIKYADGSVLIYTIKDGLVVKAEYNSLDRNYICNTNYALSQEIPALPENVEFEVEKEEFVEKYNIARTAILNATEITSAINGTSYTSSNTIVANNILYYTVPNVTKTWRVNEDGVWYDYEQNVLEGTYYKKQKSNQSSLINEENLTIFLPQTVEMTEEQLDGCSITYKKVGDTEVYYVDALESSSYAFEWVFKDGKIVAYEMLTPTNPEKTELETSVTSTISYEADATQIPALPNVEWEEVVENSGN